MTSANKTAKTPPKLAIWILNILIASGFVGCKSSLQPVYVLDGNHVTALPRSEWGPAASNKNVKAMYRVSDYWLEKVRGLELESE
jgi:hypothetical protein